MLKINLVILFAVLPFYVIANENEIRQWIQELNHPQKRQLAVKYLSSEKKAISVLLKELKSSKDNTLRGWILVCLAKTKNSSIRNDLTKIYENLEEPETIRCFAIATSAQLSESVDDLFSFHLFFKNYPSVEKAVSLRLAEVISEQKDNLSTKKLIDISLKFPRLHYLLKPIILEKGERPLVSLMMKSLDYTIRWEAAS